MKINLKPLKLHLALRKRYRKSWSKEDQSVFSKPSILYYQAIIQQIHSLANIQVL